MIFLNAAAKHKRLELQQNDGRTLHLIRASQKGFRNCMVGSNFGHEWKDWLRNTSVADTTAPPTSSRSLMKPLKMGTRSVVADSGPRMTASSWIELARVLRTWGKHAR